jgi:K+-sensing histidine kinase KdpD
LQDTQNIKKEDLIGNIHDIWIIIDNIDVQVFNLLQEKEYWNKQFEDIYVNIQKIKSIVSCATNAKFSTHTWSIVEKNIVNFIHEGLYSLTKKWSIRIEYTDNSDNVWHIIKFNPLDIYTILLNLVSNSKRAKSKIINVFFEKTESKLLIYYNDNGIWIDDNIKNNIFNLWFTTTSWSWVWLFIIKKIINWIWWTIEVYDNSNSWKWALWWATFLITI